MLLGWGFEGGTNTHSSSSLPLPIHGVGLDLSDLKHRAFQVGLDSRFGGFPSLMMTSRLLTVHHQIAHRGERSV
jgi:hypothetical protein